MMSPQNQRVAIAIACGWKHGHKGLWVEKLQTYAALPRYLNDKNAIHEAKKVLTDKGLLLEFVNQLVGIVCAAKGLRWDKVTADDHLILVATATAEQESEAFLRTLGLWEDAQ